MDEWALYLTAKTEAFCSCRASILYFVQPGLHVRLLPNVVSALGLELKIFGVSQNVGYLLGALVKSVGER